MLPNKNHWKISSGCSRARRKCSRSAAAPACRSALREARKNPARWLRRYAQPLQLKARNLRSRKSPCSANAFRNSWHPLKKISANTMRCCPWPAGSACRRWPKNIWTRRSCRASIPTSWASRPNPESGKNAASAAATASWNTPAGCAPSPAAPNNCRTDRVGVQKVGCARWTPPSPASGPRSGTFSTVRVLPIR